MRRTYTPDRIVPGAEAHIFDVDHTLTRHSTGSLFARAGRREGMFNWRQLVSLPFYYLLYRFGRLSLGAVSKEITPLRGYSRSQLLKLAHTTWENGGREDVYPAARTYIRNCRATGAPIILATSTFDVILVPLRRALGVDHAVSSVLEFDEQENSTGWLVGGPCYAQVKAERTRTLLAELGIESTACAFYTDSYHDLPSLREVGHPVAVNPDFRLRRTAQREGWPILQWDHDSQPGGSGQPGGGT